MLINYELWMNSGDLTGQTTIGAVDWNPIVCLGSAFSIPGLKSIGILLLTGVGITAYVRFHDKFSSKDYDERGFTRSKYGTYGTASWMKDKELKEILEIKPPSQADGIILGEKNGSVVCLPKDTRLNRHIAVFGASGTRKSRGVIRPALFTILKRGESAVITDPKAELYNDTAELFRKNGYEVKVFNLVDPRHGDSWNCMSDLNGDTLLAQVLTNVIISNTSEGKGDHFWDNGEANLLKALVLYIDLDRSRSPETKNLAAAYQLLTQNSERQLTALFEKLPLDHPRPCAVQSFLAGQRHGAFRHRPWTRHPVTGLTERGCAGHHQPQRYRSHGAGQAQMRLLRHTQRSGRNDGVSVLAVLFVFIHQIDPLCRQHAGAALQSPGQPHLR